LGLLAQKFGLLWWRLRDVKVGWGVNFTHAALVDQAAAVCKPHAVSRIPIGEAAPLVSATAFGVRWAEFAACSCKRSQHRNDFSPMPAINLEITVQR